MNKNVILLLGLLAAAGSSWAETYTVSVPAGNGAKYKSADWRIWIPDEVKQVRVLIVHQHGCGRNGIAGADDLMWRELARRHDGALIGSHLQSHSDCGEWWNPANGSGAAFQLALDAFAVQSNHPELSKAPWALWGHSGGSLWALNMAQLHPGRTVAVLARSAAREELGEPYLQVPVMLHYGVQEKEGRFAGVHTGSQAIFKQRRPQGALWSIAIDPKSSHDCRDSRHLAIPFLDEVMKQRLGAKAGDALMPMDEKAAWLGNMDTLEVASASQYSGDKAKASWFPNERIARAWQEFSRNGTVADKTAPPAPKILSVAKADKGVVVSWSAEIDLESGIRMFHIYRDGKKVGSLGGPSLGWNKNGSYQVWNYGDEPEPGLLPMRFSDPEGSAVASYEVRAENHAGLESLRK